MIDKYVDATDEFFIRLLRCRAHLANVREAPQTSKEAVLLNNCADELEKLTKPPQSEFDKLMR